MLFGTVSGCATQSRASYDAILGSMRRADVLGFQRLARSLRNQAVTCATRVAAVRATTLPACGRAVAVRGLGFYRDGGQTMDAAVTARLLPGASLEVFNQAVLRGVALIRIAESELGVALEVIVGKRGCAKVRASSSPRTGSLSGCSPFSSTPARRHLPAQPRARSSI